MKVVVFRELHDQQTGLRAYTAPYPDDTLFFFPNVLGNIVTAEGLGEDIILALLDSKFYPANFWRLKPGERFTLPSDIRHFMESSIRNELGGNIPWMQKRLALQQLLRAHA